MAVDPNSYELKFVVRDYESYRAHRFLGQYTMSGAEVFQHLARGNTFEIALKLEEEPKKSGKKKDKALGHLYIALSLHRRFRIENVKYASQGAAAALAALGGGSRGGGGGALAAAAQDTRLRPVDNYFHFSWNFREKPVLYTTFIWAHRYDEDIVARRLMARQQQKQIHFINHYEGRRYRVPIHCFPPESMQNKVQAMELKVLLLHEQEYEFPPPALDRSNTSSSGRPLPRQTQSGSQLLSAAMSVSLSGSVSISHAAYGPRLVEQIRQGTIREASVQFVRALGNVRIKGGFEAGEVGQWMCRVDS